MQPPLGASALIWRGDEILLIQAQGDGEAKPSWLPPGGLMEPDEPVPVGLAREVREECGLRVTRVGKLLNVAQLVGRDGPLGEQAGPAVHLLFEVEWEGELHPQDPDGTTLRARFAPRAEAVALLEECLPSRPRREPLVAYLRGDVGPGTAWFYTRDAAGREELEFRVEGAEAPHR